MKLKRIKKNIPVALQRGVFVFFLIFISCGVELPELEPKTTKQPYVIYTEPDAYETMHNVQKIIAFFSTTIDPTTINEKSFSITKLDEDEKNFDLIQIQGFVEDINDDEITVTLGEYEFEDNWKKISFIPFETLAPGNYLIIITNKVQSIERFPLNQEPLNTPTPFYSMFTIQNNNNEEDLNLETEQDIAFEIDSEEAELASKQRPSFLIINELFYDPSEDEKDGNIFIELFGDPKTEISGYKIYFINGSDGKITDEIDIPEDSIISDNGIFLIADSKTGDSSQTNIINADLIDNFDPQNGPDCAQLTDNNGALLDSLGYGESLSVDPENGIDCYEILPSLDASSGTSLSRTNQIDTDNNSVDFTILDEPTPGIL